MVIESPTAKSKSGREHLTSNQQRIEQPFQDERNVIRGHSLQLDERAEPKDHLFVLGDNRDNSNDGRFWGYLPVDDAVGKVTFIWYPTQDERIGKTVE